MAGIREVAQLAGVSIATVSRVLADKSQVSEDMRQRVLQAVEQLNYRPNRLARSLRSATSSSIALIVADIEQTYFTRIARAVEDYAQQNDLVVFLCNTDEDAQKEARYLQMMRDERVAGVILAPASRQDSQWGAVKSFDLPLVLIDRKVNLPNTDVVLIDNVAAGRDLTQHLLDHGCRRLAGIFGQNSITAQSRYEGFEQALRAAGHKLSSQLIRHMPPKDEAGYEATMQLLSHKNPPDGILVSNGLLGVGVYRAICESGLQCPEQIAFACFDETSWAALVRPSVTTLEQPTYEIGFTAAEMLHRRIQSPNRPPLEVLLKYQIRIRNSSAIQP